MEAKNTNSKTHLDYLSTEDKNHCDSEFELYKKHVNHIVELIQFLDGKDIEYNVELEPTGEIPCLSKNKISKAREALKDGIEGITQTLIENVEKYFTKKYNLAFKSMIPDRGYINLDPKPSYHSIVEHIAAQVGNNFQQAGKDQIKTRFLKSFHRKNLPELKENKIAFPSFVSLDDHSGERTSLSYTYNYRIENLINALNLFLNDATELPERISTELIEWKCNLDPSCSYKVFENVSFKFFKNSRLDIHFSSARTARKFWNYYALEIIEKYIQKND